MLLYAHTQCVTGKTESSNRNGYGVGFWITCYYPYLEMKTNLYINILDGRGVSMLGDSHKMQNTWFFVLVSHKVSEWVIVV